MSCGLRLLTPVEITSRFSILRDLSSNKSGLFLLFSFLEHCASVVLKNLSAGGASLHGKAPDVSQAYGMGPPFPGEEHGYVCFNTGNAFRTVEVTCGQYERECNRFNTSGYSH